MRKLLFLGFSFITLSLHAQVGRYEEPVDTIAIGGQVQENQEIQMQAQDELAKDLTAVRDSIQFLPPGSSAASREDEISETIQGLKRRDRSPELMKKGYTLLTEVRNELRARKEDNTDKPRDGSRTPDSR